MPDALLPYFAGADVRRFVSQEPVPLVTATPLPAASGVLTSPAWSEAYGYDRIAVLVTYAPGAAGGAFTIVAEWFSELVWYIDQRIVPTVPLGPPPVAVDDWLTVGPFAASASRVLPLQNPGGMKALRLALYESGHPATPGTVTLGVRGMG